MKKSHNPKKNGKLSSRKGGKRFFKQEIQIPPQLPPRPHQEVKERLNEIFGGKQQAVLINDQSCVLCQKGHISTEYELCNTCNDMVVPQTPLWDMPIKNMSAMDSLKGMFETNILLMIKKGSYHGKPAFSQLQQISSNFPPLRKYFAHAIVRIYMYKIYKLVQMVLKENKYPQFNGPVASIQTPADMTNALDQFDNLINQMNLQFNNIQNLSDTQIIDFMKSEILYQSKSKLNLTPEQYQHYKNDLLGLLHYIHNGNHLSKLGVEGREYARALAHSGVLTNPQPEPVQKRGFFNVFK
jgi:hypothetical protein